MSTKYAESLIQKQWSEALSLGSPSQNLCIRISTATSVGTHHPRSLAHPL